MTTYNPVHPLTFNDKLRELYYGSAAGQLVVETGFFLVGCAVIAAFAIAFTA